jgi:hypothetical protein
MASNPVPPPPEGSPPPPPSGPSPFNVWLERSGLHGKIIVGSALLGLIGTFLPVLSYSADTPMGAASASSGIAVSDWRGILALLCFIGAAVLAFLAYLQSPPGNRNLVYGLLGAAGGALLFSLLLLLFALNHTGSAFGMSASLGFGPILVLLGALGVGAGAFLKAKEDKVF